MTPAELLKCRQKLGLTQAQLAGVLGVTSNTYARWERGERGERLLWHSQLLPLALEALEKRARKKSSPSP